MKDCLVECEKGSLKGPSPSLLGPNDGSDCAVPPSVGVRIKLGQSRKGLSGYNMTQSRKRGKQRKQERWDEGKVFSRKHIIKETLDTPTKGSVVHFWKTLF